MKQLRRGGRGYDQRGGGRGGARPQYQRPQDFAQQQQQVPQLDPNNPLASLLAMQAMGMTLPGMPQFPMPDMGQQMSGRSGERCLDYDTKGFCALGASCPYEHGNDPVVVPNRAEEYDPANAGLAQNGRSASPRHAGFAERGRGRGRGRGDRGAARGGRGGRAAFSSAGPNHDKSITSVVVEQIPEEKFDEQSIRDFFSDFGTIEDLTLQSYKRLAVVQYADYDSAKRAYDSPKVVFDNRFVKVYWYKPDTLPKPPGGGPRPQRNGENGKSTDGDVEMTEEEEKMDPVEFAKKQEEAQRVHEERMKKVQEAQTARQELEQKLKAQAEERSKLLAKLAEKERAKTATPAAPSTGDGQANGSEATLNGKSNGQTEALRKKLAELESEAVSMGINPEEASAPNGFPARGRGGFRGNSRGAWNPRGAWRGGRGGGGGYNPRGGSVMRLDNRPKTVAVVFPSGKEMDAETDEALKQYLLFVSSIPTTLELILVVAVVVAITVLMSRFVTGRSHGISNPLIPSRTQRCSYRLLYRTLQGRDVPRWGECKGDSAYRKSGGLVGAERAADTRHDLYTRGWGCFWWEWRVCGCCGRC